MREGDTITEDDLNKKGWKYMGHISSGIYTYEKNDEVIFYERATNKIFLIKKKVKFSYP